MPRELHDKLEKEAKKKGLKGKKKDAYVYGTLNKIEKAKDKKAKDKINNKHKQTVVHKW